MISLNVTTGLEAALKYSELYPQSVTSTLRVQIRWEILVELKSECFSVFLETAALFGV